MSVNLRAKGSKKVIHVHAQDGVRQMSSVLVTPLGLFHLSFVFMQTVTKLTTDYVVVYK